MVIFHRYVKLPEGIPKHPPPMPVPMVGPTPAFHVFPDKLAQGPGENRMDKKKNVMIISVGVTEVDKIGILTIKVK